MSIGLKLNIGDYPAKTLNINPVTEHFEISTSKIYEIEFTQSLLSANNLDNFYRNFNLEFSLYVITSKIELCRYVLVLPK